ncbi:hypothetical protein, partial [Haemophilus parainfluenzae]|uniref:hypothetical protein n=1 Tax=Haemophilus parainfluenzae TaxID=729 RepID=UPI001CED02CD
DIATGKAPPYLFLSPWGETLWLLAWCLGAGTLAWVNRRPSSLLLSGALLISALGGIGWLALSQQIWLPVAEPGLGL